MRIDTPAALADLMGHDWLFSDEQFAAITAELEPAVVIAGAGSGKTEVMAARVVWLVATERVGPGEVLGLTFTTKATSELRSRITESLMKAGLLPDAAQQALSEEEEILEPTVATYHSYAASLLEEHGLRVGHEPDTRLIADAARYQLAARAVQRHRGKVELLTDSTSHVVQYLLALDAELSEHLVAPQTLREYDAAERIEFAKELALLSERLDRGERVKGKRDVVADAVEAIDKRAELLRLVEDYRELKASLGLMDFSDQISRAARMAQECPEVGEIERAKYKVVLLDEYQDTSVAQALMLSRLFGSGHAVTAVGDPNQAIYGWRGASVANLLDFREWFPTEDGSDPRYTLTVNRRSDSRILTVANHLATKLYQGREGERLRPKDGAMPGDVRVVVHDTTEDELDWLADEVIAAHADIEWKQIGVLTRDNASAAEVFDALTRREIPVEIVGLKGLLRLPEVAEVVAILTLLQDVTDNAALLTVLGGPRWAIGPRDLALLGARSRELAPTTGRDEVSLSDKLNDDVVGSDPIEIACLGDALADPGDGPYSTEARERFGLLADELRHLRRSVGEPILDLVRRIIDVIGVDVELASSISPAAEARRQNLDLFVQAVADFQSLDGQVTVPALVAWLDAEDEFGQGLDVATPSEADSVKLLTIHRSKGLEWDAVFLVGVVHTKFPTNTSRLVWVKSPQILPAALRGDRRSLPQLEGYDADAIDDLRARRREYERIEELRLAYVAWTRPRHRLYVSCWRWSPLLKTGLGPSEYVDATRDAMAGWDGVPERWADRVVRGEPHPYAGVSKDLPWPISHETPEADRRREAASRVLAAVEPQVDDLIQLERIRQWDDEIATLIAEAMRADAGVIDVVMPRSVSATGLSRLRDDPETFAAQLARPMPSRASASARFGTRFHAWVEARFGQQGLFDPDDLPGRGDLGIEGERDLAEIIEAFEAGPFGEREPHAVEVPFSLVLGGQVVRGRIDAVYEDGGGYLLVDWKTGEQPADPIQLAVYRVAWSELIGCPVEDVRAAFVHVRSGRIVEPTTLPDRAELAASFGSVEGS
jgi:DNA helicase-2/ATP-dependent DNA helicase PcrA